MLPFILIFFFIFLKINDFNHLLCFSDSTPSINIKGFDYGDYSNDDNKKPKTYLLDIIVLLCVFNIICVITHFIKQWRSGPKKDYKIVRFDSETDVENPDQ